MNRYWHNNNNRIAHLMIVIERDENDIYHVVNVQELEERLRQAKEDGCDGNHSFHETMCHTCYIIRKAHTNGGKMMLGDTEVRA